jgi:hypothetical protein
MTKHELALKDAEDFLRKAASRFASSRPVVTQKDVKIAAHKLRKAMEPVAQRAKRD